MIKRVVGVEVANGERTLFIQDQNGLIQATKSEHKYYLLSNLKKDGLWQPLLGNGYYQFIRRYQSKESFWDDYRKFPKGDAYAIFDDKEAALVSAGINYYHDLSPIDISTLSFDIEAVGLNLDENAKVLLITNTFRDSSGKLTRRLFAYDEFKNQGEMLSEWCKWVREIDPSIIIGHNIYNFDLKYLLHVAKMNHVTLCLGRDGSEIAIDHFVSQFRKDGSQSYSFQNPHIYGREVIDTMFLSIKSDVSRKYESYGLKQIIKQEGLETSGRQHYDPSQIHKFYTNPDEWKKIKAYASQDADDCMALWDRLVPPYFYLARHIPMPMQNIINKASGSQINLYLIDSYLAINHSCPKASEPLEFEGGISIGNPGLYFNVWKLDVASLYPSIMLHYAVSNTEKDPKGHFQKMLHEFTSERLRNKELFKQTGNPSYKALSEAQKIAINSAFGFMGAPGLNFNSPIHAAFVTEKGREILTQAMEWCKEKEFTLVNADTDSISFCKIDQSPISESERQSLLADLNSLFPSRIKWEDDGYYDSVLVKAAKNYVMKKGRKIVTKGSALKATTKEPALRECIQRVIQALLDGKKDLIPSIREEYESEIIDLQDIRRWASKKTVTAKVLNPVRTNESKILDALEGSDYQEGDKVYLYFTQTGALKRVSEWNQDHCKIRLQKKLKNTMKILEGVF